MENKDWREEFEDKYCSFEISERVSKSDMLAIISFIESLLKSKQEEIEGEMEKLQNDGLNVIIEGDYYVNFRDVENILSSLDKLTDKE